MRPVTLLRPFAPARTLRALARARHVEAVELLERGDREGWYRLLGDVSALSAEARRAERWEQECRDTAAACERILERAEGGS